MDETSPRCRVDHAKHVERRGRGWERERGGRCGVEYEYLAVAKRDDRGRTIRMMTEGTRPSPTVTGARRVTRGEFERRMQGARVKQASKQTQGGGRERM